MNLIKPRNYNSGFLKSFFRLLYYLARKYIIVLAVMLCLILITLPLNLLNLNQHINSFFNEALHTVNYPINYFLLKANEFRHQVEEQSNIKKDYIILKQKLTKLGDIVSENQELRIENQRLKSLLSFWEDKKINIVSGRLLAASPGPFIKSAVIGVGSNQKIKIGQAVVGDKALIGRVIEVFPDYSKILFINDFNSRIPVISSITRERCILAGNGENKLELLYLAEDTKVQEGELLLTSGDGQYYPYGLPIAKITKKNHKEVYAIPFLDVNSLEFASIIINK